MRARTAIAVTLVSLSCTATARAAEGDLDPSFGTGGRVVTPVGGDPTEHGMTIDAQGRILVVGEADQPGGDTDMLVVRYLPDGTPDPSFAGDGIATFDSGATDFQEADAVTVDPQGRILVFGTTQAAGGNDFAVIRVNSDGTLDTTFGPPASHGFVTKSVSGADEYASAIALDSQGRIVLAGSARIGGDLDFAVVRYDANGNPDTTFSDDGQQTVDFTPVGNDQDLALSMAIDSQGRIVLAGRTQQPSFYDFALARLTSDGARDATFGPNVPNEAGEVTTSFTADDDGASAVTIDPQGRIIAAGAAGGSGGGGTAQFALARYNPDGSLDPTFSQDGKQTTVIEGMRDGDAAYFVGVDSKGRIVAAGTADKTTGPEDYALARYAPDGELDPTFGSAGKVTLANGLVRSAVMDAGDRIVVGGLFTPGGAADSQFGLARFIGDAVAPIATISAGPADGSVINDPRPTFGFTTDDSAAALTCGFDGASAGCVSPFAPSARLRDGSHTFSVSATDLAGNSSAATRTFTVDTKAPEIKIKGKKKVKTDQPKAKDKLKIKTSEPAELTCRVDKKKPKPCEAKFKTPKLALGKHKVTVIATDRAGNSSKEKKKLKIVSNP